MVVMTIFFCYLEGSVSTDRKKPDNFFFPQLILQFYRGGPMVYFKKHYNFLRIQRGSHIFKGCPTLSSDGGLDVNFYRNL